jgi:hypothetical protein
MGRAWIQFGFGFGVADGDFALKPSFPIFLRNAIAWLAGPGRRVFPDAATVGDVVVNAAPLPEGARDVGVATVSGDATSLATADLAAGEARIAIGAPGLVRLTAGGRSEWLAARLGAPIDLERLPREEGADLPVPLPWWQAWPASSVAGALAALVLLAEWLVYRSRG